MTACLPAERYNPATNVWSDVAAPSVDRWLHSATLLPGGQVLVAGGKDDSDAISSLERYDPASDTWQGSPR